jgi:hypothetical protein
MLKLSTQEVVNMGKYAASFLGASILYGLATTAFDQATDMNTLPIPVEFIGKDPRILHLSLQLNEYGKYSPVTYRKILYAIDYLLLIKTKIQNGEIQPMEDDNIYAFNLLFTLKSTYLPEFMADVANQKDIKTTAKIDKVARELLNILGGYYNFILNATNKS